MRRPNFFAKYPSYIWSQGTNLGWRFHKNLMPSQNIWALSKHFLHMTVIVNFILEIHDSISYRLLFDNISKILFFVTLHSPFRWFCVLYAKRSQDFISKVLRISCVIPFQDSALRNTPQVVHFEDFAYHMRVSTMMTFAISMMSWRARTSA